jgi:hypothetical protein
MYFKKIAQYAIHGRTSADLHYSYRQPYKAQLSCFCSGQAFARKVESGKW